LGQVDLSTPLLSAGLTFRKWSRWRLSPTVAKIERGGPYQV
jgi:hypothetical protein